MTTAGPGYVELSRETEIGSIFREGIVAGVCYTQTFVKANQVKGK